MCERIENLVAMFEDGQMSRRDLVRALVVAAAPAALGAAPSAQPSQTAGGVHPPKDIEKIFKGKPAFRATGINHVVVGVTDLNRSRAFYEELFGVRLLVEGESWHDTQIGEAMICYNVSNPRTPGRYDHFAVAVDPWPGAERAMEILEKRFPEGKARLSIAPSCVPAGRYPGPGNSCKENKSVFVTDPDGVLIQICHPKYQLV
jgi:catechol 2,3-dioxygenase-like lactoylglutathione lyase family enzyme